MPTYVYKFIDTGETIEVQQPFDAPTLTQAPHPSDGQPRPVRKVFTPVGITFRGNGFYKTDNRGSRNGSDGSSERGSSSTDSSSKDSSSKDSSSKDSSSKDSSSKDSSSKDRSSKDSATSSTSSH